MNFSSEGIQRCINVKQRSQHAQSVCALRQCENNETAFASKDRGALQFESTLQGGATHQVYSEEVGSVIPGATGDEGREPCL